MKGAWARRTSSKDSRRSRGRTHCSERRQHAQFKAAGCLTKGPTMSRVLHPEDGREALDGHFTDEDGKVNGKYILSDKLWNYLQNYAAKHKAKGNGFGFGIVGPGDKARTLSARYYKDGSEILVKRAKGNPRRLTPRECARLMGFDKPGASDFIIPVSDTQAYKQFGNAVVVPVVEAIAEQMRPYLITSQSRLTPAGSQFELPGLVA